MKEKDWKCNLDLIAMCISSNVTEKWDYCWLGYIHPEFSSQTPGLFYLLVSFLNKKKVIKSIVVVWTALHTNLMFTDDSNSKSQTVAHILKFWPVGFHQVVCG